MMWKRRRRRKRSAPRSFVCPHCGAEVRAGASSCPECGSDESTGWAVDADLAGADIPEGYGNGYGGDDDFDYDDFIAQEFGSRRSDRSRTTFFGLPITLILALLIAVLLAAFLVWGV